VPLAGDEQAGLPLGGAGLHTAGSHRAKDLASLPGINQYSAGLVDSRARLSYEIDVEGKRQNKKKTKMYKL